MARCSRMSIAASGWPDRDGDGFRRGVVAAGPDRRTHSSQVRHGSIIARALLAALTAGMGLGEFRAEQEDLCRIANPKQQDDKSARRALGRGDDAGLKIKPDQQLANAEQNGGRYRAREDIAPFQVRIGKNFINRREHHGVGYKGNPEVDNRQNQPRVATSRGSSPCRDGAKSTVPMLSMVCRNGRRGVGCHPSTSSLRPAAVPRVPLGHSRALRCRLAAGCSCGSASFAWC
jgi:hypothetical protein